MKNQQHISDEHIVAFLDGELEASPNFEREIRSDKVLVQVTKEYSAIGKAMAMSQSDPRFTLSANIDLRTKNMLAGTLATSRGAVRTASPAPSAAPVRSVPAQRSIKYLWVKRTSIGMAFALLLGVLWFNFEGKNEQLTQVPVPHNSPSVREQGTQPIPATAVPTDSRSNQLASGSNVAPVIAAPTQSHSNPVKNVNASQKKGSDLLATNVLSQIEAPPTATNVNEQADPADVMISHRYAKMIKATRVVEITQQDRMTRAD